MLPRGPGARSSGGLPSRPHRSSQDDSQTNYGRTPRARSVNPASPRQLRPQRSLASLPVASEGSHRAPPLPELNQNVRSAHFPRPYDHLSYDTPRQWSSDVSSISSTGSSLLDRMRGRSTDTSSLTSFEDYKTPRRGREVKTHTTVKSIQESISSESETEPSAEQPGAGQSIWTSLTVNLNKAWAASITTYAGEETPPGEDSRLVRAMKAYHIQKARDPSDLPEWLFDERERRPIGRSRDAHSPVEHSTYIEVPVRASPRTRGSQDIYSATSATPSPKERMPLRRMDDSGPSKATDRLKALRDAKRSATVGRNHYYNDNQSNQSAQGLIGYSEQQPRRERNMRSASGEGNKYVGLPSGGRGRRF